MPAARQRDPGVEVPAVPMTRWHLVCALLADPAPASRVLAERLERWPNAARRVRCRDHEHPNESINPPPSAPRSGHFLESLNDDEHDQGRPAAEADRHHEAAGTR
jgi:hypothetical protein